VCIQEKEQLKVVEQARKKRKKEQEMKSKHSYTCKKKK
jgi:hypothetical protein